MTQQICVQGIENKFDKLTNLYEKHFKFDDLTNLYSKYCKRFHLALNLCVLHSWQQKFVSLNHLEIVLLSCTTNKNITY